MTHKQFYNYAERIVKGPNVSYISANISIRDYKHDIDSVAIYDYSICYQFSNAPIFHTSHYNDPYRALQCAWAEMMKRGIHNVKRMPQRRPKKIVSV